MIKLEEFFSNEHKLNLLNSNELKKIKNPDNIQYLIANYLMEDGDVLNIKNNRENEFFIHQEFIVTQPNGKWFKYPFLLRKNKGTPVKQELMYLNHLRKMSFVKHVMSGKTPDSFSMCDVFTNKPFNVNEVNKEFSKEEIVDIAKEADFENLKYTLNNN